MGKKWFLILCLVLIALAALGFFLRDYLAPAQAKLEIAQTNVAAMVYINGEQTGGMTPYEEYREPGEVTLRLVPQATEGPLAPWETKVNLVEGVTTVVRRDFGPTNEDSSGELLSFEKIAGKRAELVVVSVPDSVEVKLDGESRGFTPLPVVDAPAGEHQIVVSRPGYKEKEVDSVKTVPGYRLTVVVFLAQEPKIQEDERKEEISQTQVQILETGTGFLRVRSEPTLAAEEVAKVMPRREYLYLDKNGDGSWFKIEYEKGKAGWIKAEYAKKVEVHPEPNGSGATGSAKPKQ